MTVASKAQTATVFDFKLLFTALTFAVWHGFPVYLSLCITILSNCCFRGLELSTSQLQAIDVDKFVPENLFNCLTCCSSSLCGVNRGSPRPPGDKYFLWDGHVGKIPCGFIVVAFPAVIAIIINEAYKSG